MVSDEKTVTNHTIIGLYVIRYFYLAVFNILSFITITSKKKAKEAEKEAVKA